jgi:hypothetical protein
MTHQRRYGVSIVAYYSARALVDGVFSSLLPPVVFVSLFYFLMRPIMPFAQMYGLIVATQFCVLGLGYFASLLIQSAAFLCGCVFVLVSVAFSGVNPDLQKLHSMPIVGQLTSLSFCRWLVEVMTKQMFLFFSWDKRLITCLSSSR